MKKIVEDAQKYADELQVELPHDGDSLSLFRHTIAQVPKLQDSFVPLVLCSLPSGLYSIMTLNLLKKSQCEEKNTPEMMVLLSNLLRSDHEVESALIPKELTVSSTALSLSCIQWLWISLRERSPPIWLTCMKCSVDFTILVLSQKLSNIICADPEAYGFADMDVSTALKWLETNKGQAGTLFRALREKHAHRCYKEFDLHSKTWDIDPAPLIRTLQVSAGRGQQDLETQKVLTLDQIPKQPSFMQKKLLRFFISKAQYQVYAREATKSAMMKCFHKFRLAMRRLGDQLYSEGRIIDPELVFFLTCDEIFRLITKRDPSLLVR